MTKHLTQLELGGTWWTAALIQTRSTKDVEDLDRREFEVLKTCGHKHHVESKRIYRCLNRLGCE